MTSTAPRAGTPSSYATTGLPGKHIKLPIPYTGSKASTNSSEALTSGPASQGKGRSPGRQNALGITVNTAISRPTTKRPQQIFPAPTGFQEALQKRSCGKISKSSSSDSTKFPTLALQSNDYLSPGDGDIQICYPLTNTKSGGLQSDVTRVGSNQVPDHSKNERISTKTPAIIVTPTDGPPHAPFASSDDGHSERTVRPRASSSVYSPVYNSPQRGAAVAAPPIATLSIAEGAHNAAAAWPVSSEGSPDEKRTSLSSLEVLESAIESREAAQRISMETVLPTPRRSRGWWNLMMSPVSAISNFVPKTPLFGKSKDDSSPEASRSADYSNDAHTPESPLLQNAAPIAGMTCVPDEGLAAAYYDRSLDFDTPRVEGQATFDSDEHPPEAPALGADSTRSLATRSIEKNHSNQHELSPLHSNSTSREPHIMRHDKTVESTTRSFPPSQTEPKQVTYLNPMFGAFDGNHYHDEITTPTSPSPILGKMPTAQTYTEGKFNDRRHNEAFYLAPNAPAQTEDYRCISPPPPSTRAQSPIIGTRNFLPVAGESIRHNDFVQLPSKPTSRGERILLWSIGIVLAVLLILAVVLAMMLSKQYNDMAVQAQWLNLTGYPPIPTGISTVAQASNVDQVSGCVQPSYMWSCSLPKHAQHSGSNDGSTPTFRFEIRFNNDTISNSTLTQVIIQRRSWGSISNTAGAARFARDYMLKARDTFSDLVYTPVPHPPSLDDQKFLGNTTDDNSKPFDGEATPFTISVLPFEKKTSTDSSLVKRRDGPVPPPNVDTSTNTAMANLYPYPKAQPLRLYNKGLDSEHYGFYTYFERSIFLKAPTIANFSKDISSLLNSTSDEENENGGAHLSKANTQCTFSQSRFLVQIWTRKATQLLAAQDTNSTMFSTSSNGTLVSSDGATSSAADGSRPGSFPLPVTITLDRHGGDPSRKGVYCYGVDEDGHVILEEKAIQEEDRAFDGSIVNEASPFSGAGSSSDADDYAGTDGGDGGCRCQWQNWD